MATFLKVRFYSDPGHGWAAVKRSLLMDLGIATRITPYSFEKGQTVYLEEDQDMNTFLTALSTQRQQGVQYVVKHTNGRSPIRNYNRYLL